MRFTCSIALIQALIINPAHAKPFDPEDRLKAACQGKMDDIIFDLNKYTEPFEEKRVKELRRLERTEGVKFEELLSPFKADIQKYQDFYDAYRGANTSLVREALKKDFFEATEDRLPFKMERAYLKKDRLSVRYWKDDRQANERIFQFEMQFSPAGPEFTLRVLHSKRNHRDCKGHAIHWLGSLDDKNARGASSRWRVDKISEALYDIIHCLSNAEFMKYVSNRTVKNPEFTQILKKAVAITGIESTATSAIIHD